MDMNEIVLTGHLAKDIVAKETKTGKKVFEFTLAVNKGKDKADFIACQVWPKSDKAVEIFSHLTKGTFVLVNGSLNVDTWKIDEDYHSKTYVTVKMIKFLSNNNVKKDNYVDSNIPEEDVENDDIPF